MIFWFSRIGMTVWLGWCLVLGFAGASSVNVLWMLPLGTFIYQGFNPIEPPLLREATARILLYSAIALFGIFFIFFFFGRLGGRLLS